MQNQSTVANRWNVILVFAVVVAMATAWIVTTDRAGAESALTAPVMQPAAVLGDVLALQMDSSAGGQIYAKYDGVDGESTDDTHSGWIDVLSMEWGAQLPDSGSSGRSSGTPAVDGFTLTFAYDKAAPKLAEKLLKGEVIPRLEVEFTTQFGEGSATYLRYELKNVSLTNYAVVGEAGKGSPHVAFVNSFEEIWVIYTEYEDDGTKVGAVQYQYKVGQ